MRGVGSDDKVTILELMRKNDELESEKKKLEALLHSNFTIWENNISRLEKDIEELMNARRMGSRKMRGRRGNGGMIFYDRKDNCCLTHSPVIDLEVVELNENGSVATSSPVSPLIVHSHCKGNGHQQNSATAPSPSPALSSTCSGATPSTTATAAVPAVTPFQTVHHTDTPPKTLRGLNNLKCKQCGNVARSRCPYESCKSCCSKAQNPCHIHVLKSNATFPDKAPTSSSPLFDHQSIEASPSGHNAACKLLLVHNV